MKYLLPRGYLSSSQVELWEKSPERYRKDYFENGPRLDTKYTRFGKEVHGRLEDGTHHDLLPGMTVYPERELKVLVEIRGVPVLSYIDGYDPSDHSFGDYKTAKTPWTPAKLQKSEQMLLYAAVLRKLRGTTPSVCRIHWIGTKEHSDDPDPFWAEVDRKVTLTGETRTLERRFDEREVDRIERKVERVAAEIDAAYREFISSL